MIDQNMILGEEAIGCHLDNHRGHYISRDVIQLAQAYGFIIGPFEEWAVATYDEHNHYEDYPHEGLQELCDDAIKWLNSGQTKCDICKGTGNLRESELRAWKDKDGNWRCKECTGTGRGDRIMHQNYPPHIPAGTTWDWNDGDFGLWRNDDME